MRRGGNKKVKSDDNEQHRETNNNTHREKRETSKDTITAETTRRIEKENREKIRRTVVTEKGKREHPDLQHGVPLLQKIPLHLHQATQQGGRVRNPLKGSSVHTAAKCPADEEMDMEGGGREKCISHRSMSTVPRPVPGRLLSSDGDDST